MAKTPFQIRTIANNALENSVINGNFDFWQRGTSFPAISNGRFSADRLQYIKTGTAVHTVSRSTDVPTLAQSGFQSVYSALATITTAQPSLAAGDRIQLRYTMEGLDYAPLHGQKIRLQFWVKASIPGTYSIGMQNSPATRAYVTNYTINAANTWEKKSIDIQLDTVASNFNNQAGLSTYFNLGIGTTHQTAVLDQWQNGTFYGSTSQTNSLATLGATFQLAQVMIVKGSFDEDVDFIFKRRGRSIQDELSMCQRYYEKSYDIETVPATVAGPGQVDGPMALLNGGAGISISATYAFKVHKRISPTLAFYNVNGVLNEWITQSPAGAQTSRPIATVAVVGQNGFSVQINQAVDPRVTGHFTADAEI